ncbi:hypothetical protein ACFL31_03170 [Candidatus Margulisiibacteriota bacterium]
MFRGKAIRRMARTIEWGFVRRLPIPARVKGKEAERRLHALGGINTQSGRQFAESLNASIKKAMCARMRLFADTEGAIAVENVWNSEHSPR